LKQNKQLIIVFFFLLIIIPSCKSRELPNNITESTRYYYQIDEVIDQRKETAFTAYELAKTVAKEWNLEAILLEISPTTIVSINIPIVNFGPYWFFVFGTTSNARELYVAVSDGKIIGSFQAQPMADENLPYIQTPLEISNLIDSDVAFQKCVDLNIVNLNEINESNSQIDYRLISINDEPIWSIYIARSDPFEPICNVNANNGEITEDPFLQYQ